MLKYFSIFIVLTVLGILYDRYKLRDKFSEDSRKYDLVKKFLLNGGDGLGGKPILWVHVDHEVNARWWPSFYSRDTEKLNQPYIVSCIETMVRHCGSSFNICLINDDSFGKLIPGWSIDLNHLGNPVKEHVRTLAMSKLLYYFGGMLLPASTVVLKDLRPVYEAALENACSFSAQMLDRGSTSTYTQFFPSKSLMGCKKNSAIMKDFVQFMERLNASDYTDEANFLGQPNRWLFKMCSEGKMNIVNGKTFGNQDAEGKAVGIDRLMGNTYIQFDTNNLAGVYIPADEILERIKYQWFARLSQRQLRVCDNVAAKYILIAQSNKN